MTRRRWKRLPVRPGRCPAGPATASAAGSRGLLGGDGIGVDLDGRQEREQPARAPHLGGDHDPDQAALAGAAAVQDGGQACAAAERVSAANAARLSACEVSGEEVQVLVQVDVPLGPSVRTALSARAKAGPVR